jgi:hypothetical protein
MVLRSRPSVSRGVSNGGLGSITGPRTRGVPWPNSGTSGPCRNSPPSRLDPQSLTWGMAGQGKDHFAPRIALLPALGSEPEPFPTTRPVAEPVKLTSGRRSSRLHQHPAFCGGGSGGRGHSSTRLFQPNDCPVRPPGSGGGDQAPEEDEGYGKLLGRAHDRALRNDACGHKPPQPDEQLARQRHDHDASVATVDSLGSLLKPQRQSGRWLVS